MTARAIGVTFRAIWRMMLLLQRVLCNIYIMCIAQNRGSSFVVQAVCFYDEGTIKFARLVVILKIAHKQQIVIMQCSILDSSQISV